MSDRVLSSADSQEGVALAQYAERAYLEYALSVVKGRALPDACDGQKPVQRRILYAMDRLGLSWSTSGAPKPVKSARVVGDVLGRYHPHGDQAAYDALVRMAQDFSQRYPLIDGQGNFGSRDGDGAAAMRYTEARLSKISRLLLDEIEEGTVDFLPNYDGSTQEPSQLPARLPFTLLNGASGIAVGMATEIPSHHLGEVAQAAVALIKKPEMSDEQWYCFLPGPDFAGGGHIISAAKEIREAYQNGRGSLKVRARWAIEELARGQWQCVVNELPPLVSTQKVLEEIEELTNPKVKSGKKTLTQEQTQMKSLILSMLEGVRDESSKDAPVRLVLEPKSSRIAVEEFIQTLLAHTSLETSVSMNLTAVGLDGRPVQKSMRELMQEWIAFREQTLIRRSQFRLNRVQARIHILEGRQLVLLHIDEVIAIIRESEDPKMALLQRFALSERQVDDILEIRLRQLARLETIRIEQELSELRESQKELEAILSQPAVLRRLMIKEIESDAKTYGDERRTLIQEEKRAVVEVKVLDEPVTVVVSHKGWVRVRQGHGHDPLSFSFKSGDGLYGTFEARTIDHVIVLGSSGRVYSVAVSTLPGGRGEGVPITTLIDMEAQTTVSHMMVGASETQWLISTQGGYGLLACIENMLSRQRAGKSFVNLAAGDVLCRPRLIVTQQNTLLKQPAHRVLTISNTGRLLSFPLDQLKKMPSGGKGLMLMSLEPKEQMIEAVAYSEQVTLVTQARGGKERDWVLDSVQLKRYQGDRAKKGKKPEETAKIVGVKVAY